MRLVSLELTLTEDEARMLSMVIGAGLFSKGSPGDSTSEAIRTLAEKLSTARHAHQNNPEDILFFNYDSVQATQVV